MTLRRIVLLALLAMACAHAPEATAPRESAASADLDQASAELERQLSALSAAAAPPDCRQVCDLSSRICDLSQRICAIASRHPGDPDLAARCTRSAQRCDRSRATSRSTCTCS